MQPPFFHLRRPRREPYYLGAAGGLLLWHLLAQADGPPVVFAVLALFVAVMLVLALRRDVAGMEIRDGSWRFFLGHRRWSVALGEVGAVRVIGPARRPRGLWLRLRDGRVLRLPAALVPDIGALERALAWRGIPVEA